MPDCFISHASVDGAFASSVRDHVAAHGLDVFLAPVSIKPGNPWSADILTALRSSPWVIFLASRAACASAFVQQEVGGAIVAGKKVVPVVWDMPPDELPAWANGLQAIDIRGASVEIITQQVSTIATRVRADKDLGAVIVAALLFALVVTVVAANGGSK